MIVDFPNIKTLKIKQQNDMNLDTCKEKKVAR